MIEEFIPSFAEITRNLIIAAISYGIVLFWKRYKSSIFSFRPPGWLSAALILYTVISSGLFIWGYYQKHKPFEVYRNEIFDHQTIVLDGKSFESCTFRLCKLVINGVRPFKIKNVHMYDSQFSLEGRAQIGESILTLMKEDPSMEPHVKEYLEYLKNAKVNHTLPPRSLEDL